MKACNLLILALLIIYLPQVYPIRAEVTFSQAILNAAWDSFIYETDDTLLFVLQENILSALNKKTQAAADLNTTAQILGIDTSSFVTDSSNTLYARSLDQRSLLRLEISSDLDLKIVETISNDDEGDQYVLNQNCDGYAAFLSSTEASDEEDLLLLQGNIYSYKDRKIVQKFNFTFSNVYNLSQVIVPPGINQQYFVMVFAQYNVENEKIVAYEFETGEVSVIREQVEKKWPRTVKLSESNTLVIQYFNTFIQYFDINNPQDLHTLDTSNSFTILLINSTSIATINEDTTSLNYYLFDDSTGLFKESWSYPLPPNDGKNLGYVTYSASRGQLSLFFNDREFIWLDTVSAEVVDRFEARGILFIFYPAWYKAPVIAGDHFFNLNFQGLTQRKSSDNSFEKWNFFRGLGFYQSDENPDLIQTLALSNDDDEKLYYVTVNTKTGEVNWESNGEIDFGEDYFRHLYYTSVITSNPNGYHDAIYITSEQGKIFYNGVDYTVNVCSMQSIENTCMAYGNLDSINNTAVIVSQVTQPPNVQIILDLFDLENNVTNIEHMVLETFGSLTKIDNNNVLISVPGAANLNAHLKFFNLHTLSYIDEFVIPKSHALTVFEFIIPFGVKIDSGNRVTEGHILLVDSNNKEYIYDIARDQLEEINIPKPPANQLIYTKATENSVYLEPYDVLVGRFFQVQIVEFDFSSESSVIDVAEQIIE